MNTQNSKHNFFDDNKAEQDHTARSLRSGAVSIAARAINAVVQIGSVLFLARLLSPEDYGLVSMVAAFTGFAPLLVDLGSRDAVVQRPRISEGEVSALFWLTIAVGTGFSLAIAACSPLIARFYGEPRLLSIVLVSSSMFVVCGLSVQHYALMRRRLLFHELAVAEVMANVLSAVLAISMAFMGAEYWALVLRPIATQLFLAFGVWLKCGWWPGKPALTPGVKESLRFGLNITGYSLNDFAGRSADRVAVGYRNGAAGLGQYQNSLFVYDNLLDVLVYPLHGVAVASLSKLRDNLPELRLAWSKALSTVAFYAMPVFGLLAVTSQDVIVTLLGRKWAAAGVLLSILALRGIPHCIERTLGWLHVTAGRTDRWMRWGLFATCIQFTALMCGLPFGPRGIAIAYVTAMFLMFVPAISYAGAPLGIGPADVIRAVWRQLVASLAAAALGFFLRSTLLASTPSLLRTALLVATYVPVYLFISMAVLRVLAPVSTLRTVLRGYMPPRFAYILN